MTMIEAMYAALMNLRVGRMTRSVTIAYSIVCLALPVAAQATPCISATASCTEWITFVGAARNIGNFALLTTSANRPLSMLQLDYVAQRKFEEAVVVACIIMFVSLAGALVARLLGIRGGNVG